jgi:hypothetical protein
VRRRVLVASGGRRLLDRHLDPARGARIDAALRRAHGTGRGQAASSTSTWLLMHALVLGSGRELDLTDDDLREIEDALPDAQGDRYSEANQRMIDR